MIERPTKSSYENQTESTEQPDPIAFLTAKIKEAPDDPDNQGGAESLQIRRELLLSCAERLEVIAQELCRAFIATYAKHGFHIKSGVCFYIVGGRVAGSVMRAGSDLDCAFTVSDAQDDITPKYGEEDPEVTKRKVAARREFAFEVMDHTMLKYGLLFSGVDDKGNEITWTLLEPKVYGQPDQAFREFGAPALLITEVQI